MCSSHDSAGCEHGPEGTPNLKAVGESETLAEQVQEVLCRHRATAAEVCTRSDKRLSHQVVKLLCYDFTLP